MPNHVNTCVPAGWAVVMDVSCWHTALANTSGTDRVYSICGYTRAVGEGSRPTRQPSAVHRRLDPDGSGDLQYDEFIDLVCEGGAGRKRIAMVLLGAAE